MLSFTAAHVGPESKLDSLPQIIGWLSQKLLLHPQQRFDLHLFSEGGATLMIQVDEVALGAAAALSPAGARPGERPAEASRTPVAHSSSFLLCDLVSDGRRAQ